MAESFTAGVEMIQVDVGKMDKSACDVGMDHVKQGVANAGGAPVSTYTFPDTEEHRTGTAEYIKSVVYGGLDGLVSIFVSVVFGCGLIDEHSSHSRHWGGKAVCGRFFNGCR
eukprot:Opistho-2@36205